MPCSSATRVRMCSPMMRGTSEASDRAGDVEEGFVEAKGLNLRGDGAKDLHDAVRNTRVVAMVRSKKGGLRAESLRPGRWHRGVNTERSCFVGRREHDATRATTGDDDGRAFELGVAEQLHGCKEGIHVDVQDGAASVVGGTSRAVSGAITRQVVELFAAHDVSPSWPQMANRAADFPN